VTPNAAAAWQNDLAFVVKSVTSGHPQPFHSMSEADFNRVANELNQSIPRLPRHRIIVRIGELIAAVGDGHTRFPWPWNPADLGFHVLPVELEFFSDGLYVTAASAPFADIVGSRVIAIGDTRVDEALRRLTPVISRDNRYGIERIAKRLLTVPEVLDAERIAPLRNKVRVTFEKNFQTREILLPAILANQAPSLTSFHQLHGTKLPLHRSSPDRFYWQSTLGDGSIYAEINSVSNQPGYATLPVFCEQLLAAVDRGAPRVIVDLRHNGGGSRELMLPCVEGLAARESVNRPDRLYVVIGGETFSAALWTALDFKNRTRASFLGEPTAGCPNFYGETRRAETPEKHIPFTWASRMNWRTDRNDMREALVPDRVIRESFADYSSGRDLVLEAIVTP